MKKKTVAYIMENDEETYRLEWKTNTKDLRQQARWCGIKPGQRILDLGCGPGKTTSIIHDLVQPGGSVVGLDVSAERIAHAKKHYGNKAGIEFVVHDFLKPLNRFGKFDAVWVRFVLEYFRRESQEIVRNIAKSLHPGGFLYLVDLDHNALNHYELPAPMAKILPIISRHMEEVYNFDAYAGRKLYAHLFDLGFEEIDVSIKAHRVIYGKSSDVDSYDWMKKIEVTAPLLADLLYDSYPGGYKKFLVDFRKFIHSPRRFTYTPLILCRGRKPRNS